MTTYILRSGEYFAITTEPVQEEGYWKWTPWLSRGIYMEGIRRLHREAPPGVQVYSFVPPDDLEIVHAYFVIAYTTDEQCNQMDQLLVKTGLDRISFLHYVDVHENTKTLIFYLLP